jgi:tRNA threonylcarbamoyladenosine biosynthesis protein TsaB
VIIVAADTSTQAGSVALRKSGGQVLEEPLPAGRPHSETLLPAIDVLLAAGGVKRSSVTALAVGVGPGAFTGLRVGLATFKGWALASNTQLAPVPSLDAVAFPLLARGERVLVCGDARKGELYVAFYPGMDADGLPRCEGDVALIKPQSLPDFCRERSVSDAAVVGTGLDLVRETVVEMRGLMPDDDADAHPKASAVLSLGERIISLGRSIQPSQLVPFYVRPPDVVDPSHVP